VLWLQALLFWCLRIDFVPADRPNEWRETATVLEANWGRCDFKDEMQSTRSRLFENPLTHPEEPNMIASKTFRVMPKYACSDPIRFIDMLRRRAIEQFSTPPQGLAQTQFRDVKYELDMSLHKLTSKYFHHTHEMFLERIYDRFLGPGSTFIDIGANCGYWSAYALSRVGETGQVHAFEPALQYFTFVRRLAELNPDYKLIANNVACGDAAGRRPMAIVPPRADNFSNHDTNIGSSSLASGFLAHAKGLTETIDVDVVAFDDYAEHHSINPDHIGLIKIDVEGFEECVLNGMTNILSKSGRKVPILCEILTDLGRKEPLDGRRTIALLKRYGYRCLNAVNLQPIDIATLHFEENILCL
jgi:FkbM family methyltransferase